VRAANVQAGVLTVVLRSGGLDARLVSGLAGCLPLRA
jgi:transglutaminase-like putative cysteine protease